MKKGINDKVKALKNGAISQEEFMKKLAELDENGTLTDDLLNQVNGGITSGTKSPILDLPMLGIWLPPVDPSQVS